MTNTPFVTLASGCHVGHLVPRILTECINRQCTQSEVGCACQQSELPVKSGMLSHSSQADPLPSRGPRTPGTVLVNISSPNCHHFSRHAAQTRSHWF